MKVDTNVNTERRQSVLCLKENLLFTFRFTCALSLILNVTPPVSLFTSPGATTMLEHDIAQK